MGNYRGLVRAMIGLKRFQPFLQPLHRSSSQLIALSQTSALGSVINRYFCNVSTTSEGKGDVKTLPKSEYDKGKGDGGSGKTDSLKKDVRGGPVSWLSLVLLLITGGGLVVYYDREKKRHIEEEKTKMEIVPVFISVDPERDTVEQIHDYVNEFHPRLIGLTGTPDEIRQVARAFRVYYMKTDEQDSDYLVDHSIVMSFYGWVNFGKPSIWFVVQSNRVWKKYTSFCCRVISVSSQIWSFQVSG